MEDNRRLILNTTVSDADALRSDTSSQQSLNASTPGVIENRITLDPDTDVSSNAVDTGDSTALMDRVLSFTALVDVLTNRDASISNDTRLSSTRWTPTLVGGTLDAQFSMTSNIGTVDGYLTLIDQFGRSQPGVHYLLKEGGHGYLTFENGNRILIL